MKLRNKKTGEIKDVESLGHEKSLRDKYGRQITLSWNTEYENLGECRTYNSLAELNEEWEDAPEEPKEYWYIDCDGEIEHDKDQGTGFDKDCKAISNYFETREEAEKAVERLRAWKRLKDSGFRFNNWVYALEGNRENGSIPIEIKAECKVKTHYKDLGLLFGGEE